MTDTIFVNYRSCRMLQT